MFNQLGEEKEGETLWKSLGKNVAHTWRFSFDFLAEFGANAVVIGADVVQAPSCQLVSIVKL